MRRDSPPNDSDSSHVGCDDGPVWWLRGDRQCERAWHPIERVPAVRVVAVCSNYTAKTARTDCRPRMQLAILFLCILFALFYVSGLVLIMRVWRLASYRSDASAKRAGGRAYRAHDSHIEFDLLERINSLTKTRTSA